MSMHNKGLTKLQEECGELIQIAAKKAAYLETDTHPDGKGSLKRRLAEEVADVIAAAKFVQEKLELDGDFIMQRTEVKFARFKRWDSQPDGQHVSERIIGENIETDYTLPPSAQQAAANLEQAIIKTGRALECDVPPEGWWCSRDPGHEGPCAARREK